MVRLSKKGGSGPLVQIPPSISAWTPLDAALGLRLLHLIVGHLESIEEVLRHDTVPNKRT